jgi:type I restriction-modification system DNA methylase subunit
VSDKAFKNTPFLTKAIHDYYFAKALEHTRPGGLVAFITSRYTMDKTNSQVRRYLASKADLLGAVRLPAGTFSRNAGTEVTTDVLFLRKRAPGEAPSGESWVESSAIKVPHEDRANYSSDFDVPVNEYFQRHPELMLGDLKVGRGMHSDKAACSKPSAAPSSRASFKPNARKGTHE